EHYSDRLLGGGSQQARHEEHDHGRVEHAAEEPEEALADPEGERQVEPEDAEIEERLEEPRPAQARGAGPRPRDPAVERLEEPDGHRRDQVPARIVAERHAEVDAAARIVVEPPEEPAIAAQR